MPDKSQLYTALRKIGTNLLFSLNVLVFLITCLAAYGGYINPNSWVIPSFAVMIFPVMAVAVPAMLVIDIIFKRSMCWVMILTMFVCAYAFVFNFCPLNIDHREKAAAIPDDRKFSVITYNVFCFNDLSRSFRDTKPAPDPAMSYIINSGADVVCLQECSSLEYSMKRRLHKAQVDSLKKAYPYRVIGDNLLSVLSKTPIQIEPVHYKASPTFELQQFSTVIDGRKINFVNLHLQSIGLSSNDKELYVELTEGETKPRDLKKIRRNLFGKLSAAMRRRADEAIQVRRIVDSLDNVVVCGDFNDVPGCFAEHAIAGFKMNNAYADGGFGPTWTYNRNRFYFRIDHILYRGDFRAVSTVVDDNRGSDHYPVMSTFEFTDK